MAHRKRTEVPIYSFAKHAREEETSVIYSPHVLILEGIFALHDSRILELLDLKVSLSLSADDFVPIRIKVVVFLTTYSAIVTNWKYLSILNLVARKIQFWI